MSTLNCAFIFRLFARHDTDFTSLKRRHPLGSPALKLSRVGLEANGGGLGWRLFAITPFSEFRKSPAPIHRNAKERAEVDDPTDAAADAKTMIGNLSNCAYQRNAQYPLQNDQHDPRGNSHGTFDKKLRLRN